jgi:tetratricopeptide (TPR) repeat protein
MDPDIEELVTESEDAYRALERREKIKFYGAAAISIVVALSVVVLVLYMRAGAAERKAQAYVGSVVSILEVLSKQTESRTIPIAAAVELFKGAESILTSQNEQPGGKRPEMIATHAGLLIEFSDIYVNAGDSRKALELAEKAEKLAGQLTKQDPDNEASQALLYKSTFRIGDAVVLTDRERTKQEYDLALKIAEALATKHPGDADRQNDVTFIMNKEGDLDLMMGAWESAKKSWYQKALETGEMLRVAEPQNPVARKIVGDAWARIAGLSAAQGHFGDALKEYQEALGIRNLLVLEHPENDVYQGNLAATYDFIGGVYNGYYSTNRNSDLMEKALQQYDEALKIRFARANEDPSNASRQDSLQQEYVAIGDVLLEKRDVAGAIAKYRTALRIREALANKDPDNAGWKANHASAHEKLATALVEDQQFDAALKEYEAALEVRKDLAARFPGNRNRQSQLASAYERIGDRLDARGKSQKSQSDLRDALGAYQGGLAVIEAFIAKDPNGGLEPNRERLRQKIEGPERVNDFETVQFGI